MMTAVRRLFTKTGVMLTIGAVVVLAGAGVTGWRVADETQPAVCFALQPDGDCGYSIKSNRDGTVTFLLDLEGHEYRNERVPAECIRAKPPGSCPEWLRGTPPEKG